MYTQFLCVIEPLSPHKMLYAIQANGSPVAAPQVEDPWSREFSCPSCSRQVHRVRSHTRKINGRECYVPSHFGHNPVQDSDREECDGGSIPESDTHERMRVVAYEMLKDLCVNGSDSVPDRYPAYDPEATDMDTGLRSGGSKTKAINSRHPDAYLNFEEEHERLGNGIVLEAQYRHDAKDIRAVTHDYLNAGYSVVWARESDYEGGVSAMMLPDEIEATAPYPLYDDYLEADWDSLFPGTETEHPEMDIPADILVPELNGMFADKATFLWAWDAAGELPLVFFEARNLDGERQLCIDCQRALSESVLYRTYPYGEFRPPEVFALCNQCLEGVFVGFANTEDEGVSGTLAEHVSEHFESYVRSARSHPISAFPRLQRDRGSPRTARAAVARVVLLNQEEIRNRTHPSQSGGYPHIPGDLFQRLVNEARDELASQSITQLGSIVKDAVVDIRES